MVSGIELRIINECKRQGLDSEEILQLMGVPFEWTGNSYLFDFQSVPIETLSKYIDYIFRKRAYSLKEGTKIDGAYSKTRFGDSIGFMRVPIEYRYKVEIYSNEDKTYLKISRVFNEGLASTDKSIYGKNYLNSELNKIVDQIEFLKPSIKGYLVCNKCGAYYEVHKEESTEDFPDKCECGGAFKFINNPNLLDEKIVARKKTASPKEYLRTPLALFLVSLACISTMVYTTGGILTVGAIGLAFSLVLMVLRVKSQELVLDMIYRRIIYLLAAVLFLVESGGLINTGLQISSINITTVIILIFAVIAIIFGFGMIIKVISPENPRNFLDPPL